VNTHDVNMMFAEANLLRNLNHKNIVKIKDAFTFNDLTAVIIMEYLSGVIFVLLGRFI
jgi:serine/threonine protein kinase